MENTGISKYTISFGLSLALASVINALLVVAKEKIPAVMSGLKSLTGQHWISHAAIVVILFAAFGWIFSRPGPGGGVAITANRLIGVLVAGVVLGGLIIVVFYLAAG